MDKIVLIPSVALGLLLVAIYAIRCWLSGSEFRNAVMVNSVFQASGIVCGFFLIAGIFFDDLRKLMTGIDIYIFVSGLAVFAVSVQGFHRDAIKSTFKKNKGEDDCNLVPGAQKTIPGE